jgi:hypothetical protein
MSGPGFLVGRSNNQNNGVIVGVGFAKPELRSDRLFSKGKRE